eukprot:9369982-Pyramimonas_sp.AAC.1
MGAGATPTLLDKVEVQYRSGAPSAEASTPVNASRRNSALEQSPQETTKAWRDEETKTNRRTPLPFGWKGWKGSDAPSDLIATAAEAADAAIPPLLIPSAA